MTFNELCIWADGLVPEAGEDVIPSISSTKLDKKKIFNEACKEFVKITRCFPKDKKFNCVAGVNSYSLSSNIPDFIEFREEGIWHMRSDTTSGSTTTNWDRLEPTTIRQLDEQFETWRDADNNDYVYKYWQDGDMVYLYYTPSNSVSNGLWAYYYGQSSDMSSLTHYPFTGTTTPDPRLSAFDDLLLDFYQAKALSLLGYKTDASNFLNNFYTKCMSAKSQLQARRDIAQSSKLRVRTNMNMGNPFRR